MGGEGGGGERLWARVSGGGGGAGVGEIGMECWWSDAGVERETGRESE